MEDLRIETTALRVWRGQEEIIRRMQRMVDDLLVLARIEEGQNTAHRELVRLGELMDVTGLPFAGKARARGISIESEVPADLACAADRDSLVMIFTNLFENAAEYANDGGYIQVRAGRNNRSVEISIANTGCHLTQEDTRHVFDRFWRGDAARTDTGIHCGLGLALVQRAATGSGGAVTAEVVDGTFTVRLTLPSAC